MDAWAQPIEEALAEFQPAQLHQTAAKTEPEQLDQTAAMTDTEPEQLHQTAAMTDTEPEQLHQTSAMTDTEPEQLHQTSATTDTEPEQLHQTATMTDSEPEQLYQVAAMTGSEPEQLHQAATIDAYSEPEQLHQTAAIDAYSEPEQLHQTAAIDAYSEPEQLHQTAAIDAYSEPEQLHQKATIDAYSEPEQLHQTAAIDAYMYSEPVQLHQTAAIYAYPEPVQLPQTPSLVISNLNTLAPLVDRQFNEECLVSHNAYRELHGCPPLKFSAKLSAKAQAWADHLATLGYLQHSPNAAGNFGENVARKTALGSQEYSGSQATSQWYSEIELYNFEGVENQSRCGHFSQLVWKRTTKAGFGKATSADGQMFAVGQYLPPGNAANRWVANVPAPISGQVRVPTRQDIMGSDQDQAGSKKISSNLSLVDESNPAGRLLLEVTRRYGDFEGLAPRPRELPDRRVGRSVKVRILNGEKSLIVTLTFMRPDGSRYQLTNRVILPDDDTPTPPSNSNLPPTVTNDVSASHGNHDNGISEADTEPRNFPAEMLAAHNEIRLRHLASPLTRSESLEALAQAWSERLAAEGQLRHCDLPTEGREGGGVGQSVAKLSAERLVGEAKLTSGRVGPAALLAKQWYHERSGYRPESIGGEPRQDGDDDPGINGGHFTQMVWQSSEHLGVGVTTEKSTGDIYAVCLYRPSGNIAGQFAENVLPASS